MDVPPKSTESLLAPAALGGVMARKGMRFQDLWLLQSLTSWVVDPLFRGFVNEGREDVDTFHFVNESLREFDIERWQLKDRLVTRALLAEVVSGFEAQQRERTAQERQAVSHFHLISPAPHPDLWPLPDLIVRVRDARIAYGPTAIEYSASLDDLKRRLEKLGINVEAEFMSEHVHLDFRAGWAESSDNYWRIVHALLQRLGVAPSRVVDAANSFLALVNGSIGKLVDRPTIIENLKAYGAPETNAVASPSRRQSPIRASSRKAEQPVLLAGSHCLISYFPDEAILLQFPDGTHGLIDCGPTAIRHIVAHLSARSIHTLSFLAISHWHHTHYGGVPSLLNAVSRIDDVWLSSQVDPKALFARKLVQDRRLALSRTASLVVEQLFERAKRDNSVVHFGSGMEWIYRADRRANSDFVCGFTPTPEEYLRARQGDAMNNLSAAFLIHVAGRRMLLGGHALAKRWPHVLKTAQANHITISADGFVLPHYASRHSLTPGLIKSLVNPQGSVSLLPISELMTRRFPNITDRRMLEHIRAAGSRIVMCSSTEPMHFVLNREGLFQALSPAHV